jgi:putative tryptophan/tyrosine transport system substrate-binding protein
MRRREFISVIGGAAAAWPIAAHAQKAEMKRVGVLMDLSPDDPEGQARYAAFLQMLGGLGWIVDRNLTIEHRWSTGNLEQIRKLAADLVALAPELSLRMELR